MLKWLRNQGDIARLDQELRRIGISTALLPHSLCEELVQLVQRYFDELRSGQMFRPSDLQVLFDDAFALAAAVPLVVIVGKEKASKALGAYMYNEIASALAGEDTVYPEDLIKDLATATNNAIA